MSLGVALCLELGLDMNFSLGCVLVYYGFEFELWF